MRAGEVDYGAMNLTSPDSTLGGDLRKNVEDLLFFSRQ